ncbi:MAG: response regulator [Lentimicrobium sp.]|nr:response regulator [Lentimicrobium sp.]
MAALEKPKILIVDDIEVNLILLETVLRKEDAVILRASSGFAALEISEVNDLALIILDVSMPGMNGFELAERIRNQKNNSLTPIIFVSAVLYDQQSIVKGYQSGAVDYLTKPFRNEVLLGKVRMFLSIHKQNREIQQTSLALKESVDRYQKAENTLMFRYQLERIISLASARFSGKFDIDSSLQFMLSDLAQLLNAADALFFTLDGLKSVSLMSSSDQKSKSLPEPSDSFVKALFSARDNCNVLIYSTSENNQWYSPGNKFETNTDGNGIAIPVNLSDKPYGCILIKGCNDIDLFEHQDVCSLGVFGTISGNALERAYTRLELEKSEQKYRSYIENAPDCILVTEITGEIVEINNAAIHLFGIEANELFKYNLKELLQTENVTGQYPDFEGLLINKKSQAEFFVNKGKSTLIVKAESVQLPDGKFLIFCSDITATREMEKHLIHTERMVGIGEMATGIAHEINQPLNTISFGIDNLMQAITNKQADENYIKEKSRKIFEGIHRMRTIIDHVRTFSRSNDDYINSEFSLNESITNAISLVSEQYKNHGILIETRLAADQEVTISGNTFKMEQVILNLLSNSKDSFDEMKPSENQTFSPKIEVLSQKTDGLIRVTVSDNGSGISAEHMEHITAPFFTTKEPGKGTGLGLSISYGIVKEHKGEISFKSETGKGTTVTLEFRINDRQTDQ